MTGNWLYLDRWVLHFCEIKYSKYFTHLAHSIVKLLVAFRFGDSDSTQLLDGRTHSTHNRVEIEKLEHVFCVF